MKYWITMQIQQKCAPLFWQKINLEWFYRLLWQPDRFKRQLRRIKFGFEVYKVKFFGGKIR